MNFFDWQVVTDCVQLCFSNFRFQFPEREREREGRERESRG